MKHLHQSELVGGECCYKSKAKWGQSHQVNATGIERRDHVTDHLVHYLIWTAMKQYSDTSVSISVVTKFSITILDRQSFLVYLWIAWNVANRMAWKKNKNERMKWMNR